VSIIVSGRWKTLFIGGPLDGTGSDFVAESPPSQPPTPHSETSAVNSYRCVGYFEREGHEISTFVCPETTIADLDRFGVVDELFIKKWQVFQLFP
jgi:hypothetical protein